MNPPPDHPDPATADKVLVIVAHPSMEHSRVNRKLLRAVNSLLAQPSGSRLEIRDLYRLYPDYHINVAAEQAALARARLVVWQHPIHWYSMPPLMKLWVDEVLAFGWAYGPEGTALRGKDLWLVASTGGPQDSYRPDSYNRYFFDAFLPPYEQTATLCGMRFLPPLIFHGARSAGPEALAAHVAVFRQRLASYPQWPELEDLAPCIDCEVPASDRPQEHEEA
jgi:glutathione-regulated potassium-efflux system ancillary protein KefF